MVYGVIRGKVDGIVQLGRAQGEGGMQPAEIL